MFFLRYLMILRTGFVKGCTYNHIYIYIYHLDLLKMIFIFSMGNPSTTTG